MRKKKNKNRNIKNELPLGHLATWWLGSARLLGLVTWAWQLTNPPRQLNKLGTGLLTEHTHGAQHTHTHVYWDCATGWVESEPEPVTTPAPAGLAWQTLPNGKCCTHTESVWGTAAGYPAGGELGAGANITIAHISKYSNVVSRHICVSIWHS